MTTEQNDTEEKIGKEKVVDFDTATKFLNQVAKEKSINEVMNASLISGGQIQRASKDVIFYTYGRDEYMHVNSVPCVAYLSDGSQVIYPLALTLYGRRNLFMRNVLINSSSFITAILPDKGNFKLCLTSDGTTDVKEQRCKACTGLGKIIGQCFGPIKCTDANLCSIAEESLQLVQEINQGEMTFDQRNNAYKKLEELTHYHELCPHGMHDSHTTWENARMCSTCLGKAKVVQGGKPKGQHIDQKKPTIVDPNGVRVPYSTVEEIPPLALEAIISSVENFSYTQRLRGLSGDIDLTKLINTPKYIYIHRP